MQAISKLIAWAFRLAEANNAHLFFIGQLLLSVTALSMAYLAEYLGFKPCPLCLYARVPYFLIAFVSILALIISKWRNLFLVLIIGFCGFSVGLAAYHSAIEFGWAAPLQTCKSDTTFAFLSLEEIKAKLEKGDTQMPDCSKPALLILGLSMAQLNFILNSFLVVISIIILKRRIWTPKTN